MRLETVVKDNAIIQRIGRIADPFNPRDVTTKYVIVVLELVRRAKDQSTVNGLVDLIIANHLPSITDRDGFLKYMNNEHNWVNVTLVHLLLEYAKEVVQVGDFYRFIGRTMANPSFLLVSAGELFGIDYIYRKVAELNRNFNSVTEMEFMKERSRTGYAVIRRRSFGTYKARLRDLYGEGPQKTMLRNDDLVTQGVLEAVPKAVDPNNDFAEVVDEPYCVTRGDDFCEYHLEWSQNRHSPVKGIMKGVETGIIYRLPAVKKLVDKIFGMEVVIQQKTEQVEERTAQLVEETEARMKAEELAGVAQLSFGLGHDLRNILSKAIQSGIPVSRIVDDVRTLRELYRRGKLGEAEDHIKERNLDTRLNMVSESFKTMNDSLAEAIQNIRALEGYTTEDGSDFISLRVEDVLEKVLEDYADRLREIKVETQFVEQSYSVKGNPLKLYRVFLNILINSLEALEGREAPGIVVKTKLENGKHITLIEDNGIGVSEEVRKNIFKPYTTTKGLSEGRQRGLGLSITHDLVKQHGGTIEMESCPGEYTRMIVSFDATV